MKSVQQPIFNSQNAAKDTSEAAEEYKFEPIQGYPMLHWKGKRPYRSTQYYPAQLKESHGDPVDGWFNRIYWGDNLQVMSHLLREFRGKVQLVYIDPPYDSKAEYKKKISLKRTQTTSDHSAFEEKQYTDIWTNDEYLQFIYERLVLMRELLSETGCIYLHCDWHKSHHLRCLLDEIFGSHNFRNDIIWYYPGREMHINNKFNAKHDIIYFYAKTDSSKINMAQVSIPYDRDTRIKTLRRKIHQDVDGREWVWETRGQASGQQPYKRYIDEIISKGHPLSDVWNDLQFLRGNHPERENYPTQKPEALLERIIKASSNPGDLVFDCFMGSGTTQAVAMKLGRKFVGADINLGAVQITTKRLLGVADDLKQQQAQISLDADENAPENLYTGFSVYNVNHYDVFRNPVQAKELLIEAFAVQPLPSHTIYDGQKDGRMVRIMPVNRIATKADLNELLSNFDYKAFEKRQAEHPKSPVEKITLICMGHEPDLAAHLEKEAGYKLDVNVVDILRDKANLEFKRDSEARIAANNGNLIVENFYPMNLLQKLSLFRENVEDWRELVESVMIDWTYDGTVFRPAVTDIPGKKELVSGIYPLPERTGTIRVKITDLLSESWEGEVVRG